MEHTPTPWRFEPAHPMYKGNRQYVWGPDGPGRGPVAILEGPNHYPETTTRHKANAEFIVRAANNHESLLDACEAALAYFEVFERAARDPNAPFGMAHSERMNAKLLRAAIAKAKSNG